MIFTTRHRRRHVSHPTHDDRFHLRHWPLNGLPVVWCAGDACLHFDGGSFPRTVRCVHYRLRNPARAGTGSSTEEQGTDHLTTDHSVRGMVYLQRALGGFSPYPGQLYLDTCRHHHHRCCGFRNDPDPHVGSLFHEVPAGRSRARLDQRFAQVSAPVPTGRKDLVGRVRRYYDHSDRPRVRFDPVPTHSSLRFDGGGREKPRQDMALDQRRREPRFLALSHGDLVHQALTAPYCEEGSTPSSWCGAFLIQNTRGSPCGEPLVQTV